MSFHLRGLCRILILVGLFPPGFTSTYIYFQVKNKKATIITNKQNTQVFTAITTTPYVFALSQKGF